MTHVSNNSNLTVSVVMCTYNGESFIHQQITSIVSQTYPVKELLIFDDASTDKTVKVITEIVLKYPFIKLVINKKNVGFTKNFEQAIKAASGDVIAISDQDDIWINTKIEKMIKAWKKESPLIYCNSFVFSHTPPENPRPPKFRQFKGTDARKIYLFNTVSGHAILIKKQFVPLVIPFEEGTMYDWWMAVVAAYNGGVQHHDEVLVYHRTHSKNITVNSLDKFTKAEQRFLHQKLLIKQFKKFSTAPNIPPSHKDFLIKYCRLMEESLSKQFYLPLFLFLLKNRCILLNNKKRKIGILSNIKHSYLQTFHSKNIEQTLSEKFAIYNIKK